MGAEGAGGSIPVEEGQRCSAHSSEVERAPSGRSRRTYGPKPCQQDFLGWGNSIDKDMEVRECSLTMEWTVEDLGSGEMRSDGMAARSGVGSSKTVRSNEEPRELL